MDIKVGDVIVIRHYSGLNPFRSYILAVSENTITTRLTKEFAVMNFLTGEPVVFGYEANDEIHVVGSNIININLKNNSVELELDTLEMESQKRRHERFPVSLYADFKLKNTNKKHIVIIKDVSFFGMKVYSKDEFDIDSEYQIDLYLEKYVLMLKAKVLRKSQQAHYFEYGMEVIYDNSKSLNTMKEYLDKLKYDQDEFIKRLRTY